ncbi:aldehyde dehydrogenase family protein [Bacillus sp. FJAT-42376]|uniref:aldehyde dehydrogenase family protein n=1 Tax=Bacillus sp. FJAT-42376 TaxID=2014076 RepID=UPI000F5049DB|nr:aldehyde dehydrogenase family protein [Bacillus sp. FJAT-42376]AZB42511.1 aldehyde dehydrogenase family protein [Bacillus sp. FJAT-42376]
MLKAMNPATGNKITEIEEVKLSEAGRIFQQAEQVQKEWQEKTIKERLEYFKALRLLMASKLDAMTTIVHADTGKPKAEALATDIMPVIDSIQHLEKTAESVLGRQNPPTPMLFWGKKSYIEYMARGTVLIISPWNYPLQLAVIPVLSALAGGNAVVLKPSEVTPLTGKLIELLFKEAGFPDGLVQVAQGGKELGEALVKEKPDYIFFTGSVKTGKIIQEQAAKDLIPTTLELGGKDPFIVFEDANLDRAAKAAVWGAFTNSGQVCMSTERVYVEGSVYQTFVRKVQELTMNLKQGASLHDDLGSMTFPQQVKTVKEQVEDAISKGAKLAAGNVPSDWDENSMYIKPMILVDVKQDMAIMQDETFGPVMPIMPFDTEEEAIELANGTVYGLNASVWSSDSAKAERVVSRLVTGNAAINDVMLTVMNPNLPFGGAKQSGIGRYHGEGGLRIFCHEKSVMADPGKRNSEIQWYPYRGKYKPFKVLFETLFGRDKNWKAAAQAYRSIMKQSK